MDKKLLKEEYKRLLTKAIEGRQGGMALMLNTGESPSAGAEYMLSAILVENPPEWSFLSEKALNGILNRASRRGKKLQDLLLTAIHGMIEWWHQNPAGGATWSVHNENPQRM